MVISASRFAVDSLCPGGRRYDAVAQARVSGAARANRGMAVGVVHPLFCAPRDGAPKPVFGNPLIDRQISGGAYNLYLDRLGSFLRGTFGPVLVFAEPGQQAKIEDWLPVRTAPVVFIETMLRDPLPRFGGWQYLAGVLRGARIGKIMLTGEKTIRYHGVGKSGCVVGAYDGLRRAGLAAEIMWKLTFPNITI